MDDKDASDGEASYTEFTNITLNFIDINDDPIFNQSLGQWNISFLEADVTQIQELPDDRTAYYAAFIGDSSDLPSKWDRNNTLLIKVFFDNTLFLILYYEPRD